MTGCLGALGAKGPQHRSASFDEGVFGGPLRTKLRLGRQPGDSGGHWHRADLADGRVPAGHLALRGTPEGLERLVGPRR